MLLFFLLPAPIRRLGSPDVLPFFYAPIFVLVMGLAALGFLLNGDRFIRQARTIFEATQFQSLGIFIEIVGNLSRADVKVGRSMTDSIESSSVVARSDFTARFWAAELISEATRLDSPRELLALNQTYESQEWVSFFRSEINTLREEGVKPVGVDLRAGEVTDVIRANVGVSALRSEAIEKAKLQVAQEGGEPPQLSDITGREEKDLKTMKYLPEISGANQEEYKECPDCAEMVRIRARKCRFCGYRFDED
jgi:hypothetical protein